MTAVALPSFIGQIGKAREVEFTNSLGTINRSQQSYHWEKGVFAQGLTDQETLTMIGISLDSKYIDSYNITGNSTNSTTSLVNNEYGVDGTRGYSGGMFYNSGTYQTVICRSKLIASQIAPPPNANNCLGNEIVN